MPARRPPRSEISLAPAAITSSGEVIVGLGYCSMAKNVRELLKVVSTKRRADALRRLDDAAAEAAALSGVGASRKKGSGA